MGGRNGPVWQAHVLLVLVTLVWGLTFPLIKAALREVSPLLFNALRMTLASVLLLLVNAGSLRGLHRRQVVFCALPGLFLALGYELQTAGLVWTTPSKSAFLTGLVVVLVPLLSLLPGLHRRDTPRPHRLAYVGALVAFAGIVLMTSTPDASSRFFPGLVRGFGLGEWLSLACAVAFALHLLVLSRSAHVVPARVLGTLQIVFATGAMLLALPLQSQMRFHASRLVVLALLVSAVLATAAAFTIQSWAQQHLPATHTALILTLEPVFAALASLVLLGERWGVRALTGAACILLGIVLAELGPTALSQTGILPIEP